MVFKSLYSEKVMDHLRRPRNMGEMKNPDGLATVGNPVCGDIMRLFLRIGRKKDKEVTEGERGGEYIKDIKFQTLGCGAAIATSSMLTLMVKGRTLKEAEKVTRKAVADALGGLPPQKLHCSVLAADALKKAIEDYRQKRVK